MSSWINTGSCSATCGGGIQLQQRQVLIPAAFGGLDCPTLIRNVPCSIRSCACALTDNSANCTEAFRPIDGSGAQGQVDGSFIRTAASNDIPDAKAQPTGATQPSARLVSTSIFTQTSDAPSSTLTTLFVFFGQILDHDLTLTAQPSISTCIRKGEPMPIPIPDGDPVFGLNGNQALTTMDFARTDYCLLPSGKRDFHNAITSVIDASFLYGSFDSVANALRTHQNGLLATSADNMGPNAADIGILSEMACRPGLCYGFGDGRGNENAVLSTVHILFLREHNRVAAEIKQKRPTLNDEDLYQLARKQVVALVNSIVYNEWLPALLGSTCPGVNAYNGYDSSVNPQMSLEFSTAAFRLGHTALPNQISLIDEQGVFQGKVLLRDLFFRPSNFNSTNYGQVLLGQARQPAQDIDIKVIDAVHNLLFTNVNSPSAPGQDLMALNIQRGRELGIAKYNDARQAYGLRRKTSFAEVTPDPLLQAQLASVYPTVDDIELWPGGLAEAKFGNSQIGEIFTSIVCDQFTRVRTGDPYYFERPGQMAPQEAAVIKATKLADVIARNTQIPRTLLSNTVFVQETGFCKLAIVCCVCVCVCLNVCVFCICLQFSRLSLVPLLVSLLLNFFFVSHSPPPFLPSLHTACPKVGQPCVSPSNATAAFDPILYWNGVANDANQRDFSDVPGTTKPAPEQGGPTLSSRAYGITHLAMYDAYAAAIPDPDMPRYLTSPSNPTVAIDAGAAVAYAAYTCLKSLYPRQILNFDAALAGANLPTTQAAADGRLFGIAVAQAILTDRAQDPSASGDGWKMSTARGHHRPDPSNPGQGFHAPFYGARSKLFLSRQRYELDPPPALDSQDYKRYLKQVRSKGIHPKLMGTLPADADRRRANETVAGIFWAYDGVRKLGTPPRLFNLITRRVAMLHQNSVKQNAKLFALVNGGLADAGILCWDAKYIYDVWRPVLGVREGDPSCGISQTRAQNSDFWSEPDPEWMPMGAPASNSLDKDFTPPFPAYPSGHATFGGVAFHTIRLFYGVPVGDRNYDHLFPSSLVSEELNGVTSDSSGIIRTRHERDFPGGLMQMIEENGFSRVYLGVHWAFDAFAMDENLRPDYSQNVGGASLGMRIAEDIFTANAFHAPQKSTVPPRPFCDGKIFC